MSTTVGLRIVTLATTCACTAWAPLTAQSRGSGGAGLEAPDVCALVSHDQVKKLSEDPMTKFWSEPEAMMLRGGSVCQYGGGVIYLFSGDNSEASWNGMLKAFKQDAQPRTPIGGIGDRAYLMYGKPQNEYQDRAAFVVATVGRHTVAMALFANGDEPLERVRPRVEALARLVVPKLR